MKILITGASGFIGTNLVDHLLERKINFLNIDIKAPSKASHGPYWKQLDIMDIKNLKEAFKAYSPTHVIHLAARTDTDSSNLSDYSTNTKGTENVLEAINESPSVTRAIITSTQFVFKPGRLPASDEDFAPHTTYGESKVITEKLTRAANLKCSWTIIRPTNVWGPWHSRYPKEFWRVLQKGMYFHPGKNTVTRSYAYVGNVVDQIMKIFEKPAIEMHKKVFYVGDKPINLYDWVNGFSRELVGRDVRVVPRILLRTLGLAGDILSIVKIRFPITSSRYRSMIQDYLTPMEHTFEHLGPPPYSMEAGIKITGEWLRNVHNKERN